MFLTVWNNQKLSLRVCGGWNSLNEMIDDCHMIVSRFKANAEVRKGAIRSTSP